MTEFMKTVLRLCIEIAAATFSEKRSDTVHKYGQVVLRVLSTSCTLKRKL